MELKIIQNAFKKFPFQLDTALKRMYNYLQRFAVGLEVMVEDQAMYDGEFIMEFNEAEYKLKAVRPSCRKLVMLMIIAIMVGGVEYNLGEAERPAGTGFGHGSVG